MMDTEQRRQLACRLLLDAAELQAMAAGYADGEPVRALMERRARDCASAARLIAPDARVATALAAAANAAELPPEPALQEPTLRAAIDTAELILARRPDDALRSPMQELRSIVAELEAERA